MRPVARHLGVVILVLGACALMGAAPKKAPAAKPAKAGTKATAAVAVKTTAKAKSTTAKSAPVAATTKAAPAAAGMRIFRDPDEGTPVGVSTGAVIEYVEPVVEEVGVPVVNMKADGSIEVILNGTGQDFTTITLGKDGARHISCDKQGHNHSAKATKSAKATPAPSAQPEER